MKLSELIKTEKVKIPGTDFVVEIRTELAWFDQLECVKINDEIARGRYLMLKLIVNWNLEGEDDQPLPVTKEIIRQLPSSVAVPIAEKITKIAQIKILKKNN